MIMRSCFSFLGAVIVVAAGMQAIPAVAEDRSPADPRGPCPGAFIDYERAKQDPFGPGVYIPVQVQVRAFRELRKCAKAGIEVPATVAEYNQQSRLGDEAERRIKRALTPNRPWGEF